MRIRIDAGFGHECTRAVGNRMLEVGVRQWGEDADVFRDAAERVETEL